MQTNHSGAAEGVLRLRAVSELTGLGRSTLYEIMRENGPRYDPTFPRPILLGPRARGYWAVDVVAWLEKKTKQYKRGANHA